MDRHTFVVAIIASGKGLRLESAPGRLRASSSYSLSCRLHDVSSASAQPPPHGRPAARRTSLA